MREETGAKVQEEERVEDEATNRQNVVGRRRTESTIEREDYVLFP
jgi:hypothetical protein